MLDTCNRGTNASSVGTSQFNLVSDRYRAQKSLTWKAWKEHHGPVCLVKNRLYSQQTKWFHYHLPLKPELSTETLRTSLVEQRIRVGLGVERHQVADLLARAHEANRQAQLAGDCYNDSTFCRAV